MNPIINIYHGDCMEAMAKMKDRQFDLAIVDPPYGINAPNMAAIPCQRKRNLQRLNGGGGKLKNRVLNQSKKILWDYEIPTQEYFNELKRISVNQIIWGGNYFPLPPTRHFICWDKVQPWENFSQVEFAWTSFDYPATFFKYDNRTGDKIHPTQKPIALYKWLLSKYAKKGDKILDTHLGSGSIAIACHDLGFYLEGYELDEDYYKAALERYERHASQQTFEFEQVEEKPQYEEVNLI